MMSSAAATISIVEREGEKNSWARRIKARVFAQWAIHFSRG
uniref:Uncharacterized protein n=1 Tax=Pristionchus pacificus TaxID=54126 RepID=A0A2A6B9P0_PRIPA|eukprot:PDM62588.1 hypothetical protein PRIPAC_52030 [Pristionchus pacificus]